MSAFSFAAAPTTGSVKVDPANDGQIYTLYRLFDAHITFGEKADTDPVEYEQNAITYTLPSGKSLGTTGEQWFRVNSNGFVELADGVTEDNLKAAMKTTAFKNWAKNIASTEGSPITAADGTTVEWTGIPFGYYFVDSTLGSFVSVNSNNPEVTVADKNNPPKLDKKIKSVKDSNNADSGSIFAATGNNEIQFEGDGTNEHAIAQIGDTVTYTIEVTAKPGAENYVVTDTLAAGLTAPLATAVTVKAGTTDLKTHETKTGTKDAAVSVSGQVITVTFDNSYLNSIAAGTVITIEYSATINSSAVVATGSNDNTAKLEWGHKSTKDYTEDQSKVWTANLDVAKKIGSKTGDPLAGAGFILKRDSDSKYYKLVNGVVTWVDEANAQEITTTSTGALRTKFTGLANGTYTLIEKTVPAGYNKMGDTSVTIANNDVIAKNLSQTKTVINNAGTTLPSTGGIGTTIFYILGALLVVGAGVLLVARRRMNAND